MHLPGTEMPAEDTLSRNLATSESECFLDGSLEYCGDEGSIFAMHVSALTKIQAVTWEHVKQRNHLRHIHEPAEKNHTRSIFVHFPY